MFAGLGRSVLVLAVLWWAWSAYAWLTNIVDPEEGVVGAALLVALIAMFVAALVVCRGVFDDQGVLFGVAFVVVCAMHLALYALAARGNRDLLGSVVRLTPWTLLGATLILVAGFADGVRTWLWLAYFDVFSIRGERMLGDLQGAERVASGRGVFTYTHSR